jgi:FkbM family methyltransferase
MKLLQKLLIQIKHPVIALYNIYFFLEGYICKNILGLRKTWEFDNGLKVYKDQLIGFQILRYKKINLHEPEEEPMFCRQFEGYSGRGVFLDVGAAAGYYSFLTRKLCPKIPIHAFNPRDDFFKMMGENVLLNEMSDIHIHKLALSNATGTCGVSDGWGGKITSTGNIQKTTFDEFLKTLPKNEVVFLVKMDIQGEEYNALCGAEKSHKRIKHWFVETHSRELHEKCESILESFSCKVTFNQFEIESQPSGLLVASRQ